MRIIFVDTSFFYAFAYIKDRYHLQAVEFLARPPSPLITTNFIFDELVTILRYDFGHEIAANFGEKVLNSKLCTITRITFEDEKEAWKIFRKYEDQSFSFTDCTSFALMKRLEISEAACFDAHFDTVGFTRLPPIKLRKM
jgi:predicted nucleic acid-binding protein